MLALLMALALSFQGVPLAQAELARPTPHHVVMPEAAPPCHDMAGDDLGGDPAPRPAQEKADPFACCAAFACGMLVQALPPEAMPARLTFTTRFDRPSGLALLAPGTPDSAWRPPAFRL
jgi:hypothetical protein